MTEELDVVVVGGGIHGAGVAQAAAADGYRVRLLEQASLAAGTSGRSSKLIHGGLRYLETASISLVRESLRERELLLRIAPTLVERRQFFIPVFPNTRRRPWQLRIGLSAYALLAGLRGSTKFRSVPRSEWDQLDGLSTQGLQHVFQYWDAQTDDAALTRAVMTSAESLGAEAVCPAEFVRTQIDEAGCTVVYRSAGVEHEVRTLALVNAAGPWAHGVLDRISPRPQAPSVQLVQGSHLELPGRVEHGCYYVESPSDGRAVFVMPWRDHTLLGTTERAFTGDPADVRPHEEEVAYLLEILGHYFPERSNEVLDSWAGLRVLPVSSESAFKTSRETLLPTDDAQKPRVLSILGGKLTGYRATAQRVMGVLRRTLPQREKQADTRELVLGG